MTNSTLLTMIFESLSSCCHIFKDFFLKIAINTAAPELITLEAQPDWLVGVSERERKKKRSTEHIFNEQISLQTSSSTLVIIILMIKPGNFCVSCNWFSITTAELISYKQFSKSICVLYLQCGLSFAPTCRRVLAMGTLFVKIAISKGVSPSLFGVFRSSSSRVYW